MQLGAFLAQNMYSWFPIKRRRRSAMWHRAAGTRRPRLLPGVLHNGLLPDIVKYIIVWLDHQGLSPSIRLCRGRVQHCRGDGAEGMPPDSNQALRHPLQRAQAMITAFISIGAIPSAP
jgi:hypothetical protein